MTTKNLKLVTFVGTFFALSFLFACSEKYSNNGHNSDLAFSISNPTSFQSSKTHLNLSPDNTFVLRQGEVDSVGRWKLSDDKAFVLLDARREALVVFQVVKDGLVFAPDKRPTDQVLHQQKSFVPLYPKMRWIGLYRYMADAASFEDCASGKRYPVEMVKDHLALERAYLKNRTEAGAPLRVMFEGEVVLRPSMEGNRDIPTMQVIQFIRVMDEPSCQPSSTFSLKWFLGIKTALCSSCTIELK